MSRERVAQLLGQYRALVAKLEGEHRAATTRLRALQTATDVAKKSEERLVEEASTKMKAGGVFATTTGTGAVALLVKFGLVACPIVLVPILGGIMAGNALSSRTETRRTFGAELESHAEQRVELEAEVARLEQELSSKREKLARVEALWKKVR